MLPTAKLKSELYHPRLGEEGGDQVFFVHVLIELQYVAHQNQLPWLHEMTHGDDVFFLYFFLPIRIPPWKQTL